MPSASADRFKPSECQADFTYTMTLDFIKIQNTGKGTKSVADDLKAVLRKIEGWHQGLIAGLFRISLVIEKEEVIDHCVRDRFGTEQARLWSQEFYLL